MPVVGQPTTALVTGGLGFVGRHLLRELQAETDWRVIALSRRAETAPTNARVVACDLLDAELLHRLLAHHRPDVIFHLAAQSYVPQAFSNPAETLTNNITAQVNLLEGCRAAGIDPIIIITGSSEEYGQVSPERLPIDEDTPLRPVNPYAVSKVAQDLLGLQYALAYGMKIIRVRPFNHFGPEQSERFVLSVFARQIAQIERGLVEPVVLTGNLDAVRDFLDVRDVVRAYRLLVASGKPGEVYNVASGVGRRIGDLLQLLLEMSDVPISRQLDPSRLRPSDIPVFVGNAKRLREATGWEPRYSIEQSLADQLTYWREVVGTHVDRSERGDFA